MGDEKLQASIAHLVLCCVAGRGISRMSGRNYTHPGMHANLFLHGVFGFLNNQSELLGNDFAQLYGITQKASRYLPLPCLMADMYRSRREISLIHFLSGVIPFAMAVTGKDNPQLGNMMVACNIVSLLFYSIQHDRTYGYYTTAAAILAYYVSPQMSPKITYPLGLALMEYCAYKMFFLQWDI